MNILLSLGIALNAIKANKLRSFLTTLGIIIGVAAVLSLVTVTQGAKKMIENQLTSLGAKSIIVNSGPKVQSGISSSNTRVMPLTDRDVEKIEKLDTVQYVSAILDTTANAVNENRNWYTNIVGVSPSFLYINDWFPVKGTFFNNYDVSNASLVAVLGNTVKEALFGSSDPVGQKIRIGKYTYKVIGVMQAIGQKPSGTDQDDLIIVPYTTVQKRLLSVKKLDNISISVYNRDQLQLAKDEITKALRESHNLMPGEKDDFNLRTQENQIQTINSVLSVMSLLLASIASISLIVGGIGIMNIMLVSVSQRTREIGIRMAVGARKVDILKQFLVESITLSLLGGILGVAVGMLVSKIVSLITKWPVNVSILAIVISFFFATLVGIIFGIYPARKASTLNPIESLRYE